MSRRFVHLTLHSEYSLADSTIRIPELVKRCVAMGQPSVAVTAASCSGSRSWRVSSMAPMIADRGGEGKRKMRRRD